ncbi:MAG: hydroxylamine reductase, partial [Nitrosomonas sp.]
MSAKLWLRIGVLVVGMLLIGSVQSSSMPSVPDELFEALKIDRSKVTPKELHEALVKRYKDPEQGAGRGTLAQYWE